MNRADPAQLLRSLEEEAKTLRSMMAKVADSIHCLQVEEEYLSTQLVNLEKAANEGGQRIEADGLQVVPSKSHDDILEDDFEWTPPDPGSLAIEALMEEASEIADSEQDPQVDEDIEGKIKVTDFDGQFGGISVLPQDSLPEGGAPHDSQAKRSAT